MWSTTWQHCCHLSNCPVFGRRTLVEVSQYPGGLTGFIFFFIFHPLPIKMGKQFGQLARIRGLITYKISAYEQRAFAGMISHSLPNLWTRFTDNVFRVAPPFVVTYLLMDYLDKEHARLQRKNPKDYENDE